MRVAASVIASGGELQALLSAVQSRQDRRNELDTRIRLAEALVATTRLDAKRLERELLEELDDWRGLPAEDAAAARPVFEQLLPEKLAFTPLEPGTHAPVAFRGKASIGGLLTGLWLPARPNNSLQPCFCQDSIHAGSRLTERLQ